MTNRTIKQLARILLLISFYWVSSFQTTYADTNVSGEIAAGTIWNKAGSPYIITELARVPEGVILTIEPGTIVKLQQRSSLEVAGSINGIGSEAEPISFTVLNDDSIGGDTNGDGTSSPLPSDTYGLNFFAGSSGHFEYANILHALIDATGATSSFRHSLLKFSELSIAGPGSSTIQNSTFEDPHALGIEIRADIEALIENTTIKRAKRNALQIMGGTVTLTNSTIADTQPGIDGNAIYMEGGSTLTMTNSTLSGGSNGIKMIGQNAINVTDSVIKKFSRNGVWDTVNIYPAKSNPSATFPIVTVSVPISTASEFDGATIAISKTEITGNGVGLLFRNKSITSIQQNSIHGNGYGANGLALENNWWGDTSGPHDEVGNPNGKGDEVIGSAHYKPWLTADPLTPVVACCSSVVFLPGIEGSRLYSGALGDEKLWEPFGNADIQKLYLNSSGKSIDQTIYTKDILDQFKAFGIAGPSIYKGFINEMNELVANGTMKAWKPLPYDWREAVTDIVQNGTKLQTGTDNLVQEIEQLAVGSKTGKVTIVAHSNGGLVAKALTAKLEVEGKAGLVDKVIFVTVPQLGTPDAVSALLHGTNLGPGGIIMSNTVSRSLAENMPGVYGLLPSEQYFEQVTDPVITFDQNVSDIGNFIEKYGATITTIDELNSFLSGKDGRTKPSANNTNIPNVLNDTLINQANSLHQVLDGWKPSSGIDVVQIAGLGKETLKGITYTAKYPCTKLITLGACAPYLDEKPVTTIEGDKTVVLPSATTIATITKYLDLYAYDKFAEENYDHKNILEARPVLDFLKYQITGSEELPEYITNEKPTANSDDSIQLSVHSPVAIDLYDIKGNHTGLLPNQENTNLIQYEENIPNSYYMEFGEGKYVGFDGNGAIHLRGTGIGTFTLNLERKHGDIVIANEMFAGIPVTANTKAEVVIQPDVSYLELDSDGDGTKDFTIKSSQNDDGIDPVLFLQIMKKNIHTLDLEEKTEQKMQNRIDRVIKLITLTKKENLQIYIKQFAKNIEQQKVNKSDRLTIEQKGKLVEMIGNLLDTIV